MSLASNLYALGALMKTNLESKGVTGLTSNMGLTTLANKILDIEGGEGIVKNKRIILDTYIDYPNYVGSEIIFSDLTYNGYVIIDWGDGTAELWNTTPHHTYSDSTVSHTIQIIGDITSIGNGCFLSWEGKEQFTNIRIPDTVTLIGEDCFANNFDSFHWIQLPESLEEIGDLCFAYCQNLEYINIPSSVSTLGDYCFDGCYNLKAYILNWDSADDIIPYSSRKMPVHDIARWFIVPEGTASLYLNKGYPSDYVIDESFITFSSDIDNETIGRGETSTVQVKVYSHNAIGGVPINYVISHGGTVIDEGIAVTGYDDGVAEISYVGTGVGEVTITVSYGTLLQEIYEVLDCSIYDEGTIASHNDIWGTSSYGTITRQSEYSVASRTQTTDNASFQMNFGDNDTTIIIFDYMKVNGENSDGIVLIRQGSNTNVSTLTNNRLGGVIGEWNTVKITIDNNTPRITVDNLTTGHTFTNTMSNTGNRFRWALYGETTEIRFKKFRVYSI